MNNPQPTPENETFADLMAANLTGKSRDVYPTEQSFGRALVWSGLLVFVPSMLLVLNPVTELESNHLYQAVWGNWISPFILWFFATSILHLVSKRRRLKAEMKTTHLLSSQIIPALLNETSSDLPPLELFRRIRDNLLRIAPKTHPRNLLLSRCHLLLDHNTDTTYDPEASDRDGESGLFDREYMHSSFALPRFMAWAIPILGFIGTVWGISQGISEFSTAMNGADSTSDASSTLKDSLPLVTESLATAFDTTFIALILSVPLMLLLSWMEKAEEQYLVTLDKLWLYEIKPKFSSRLPRFTGGAAWGTDNIVSAIPESVGVGAEINLLSAQVGALQETMQDLYESVFASNLAKRGDED